MVIPVAISKSASTPVAAVGEGREGKTRSRGLLDIGRRGIFLSMVIASSSQVDDSRTELLNKYLKKTEENKAKNAKERLDSYYKRNYKDYFGFAEGSLRAKKEDELTDSERAILKWLETNK